MFFDLIANIVHDFFDPAARQWFSTNEKVARVCFSDAAAELQASAPGIGLHFRSFLQNGFHLAQETVSFGERSPGRRNVIQYETAFVHGRHKSGANAFERDEAKQQKRHQKDNYEARPAKKPLHVFAINFVHATRETAALLDFSVFSF